MRTLFIAAFAGLASLSLASQVMAQPAQPPPAANQCFARSNVQGFSAPDDRTVYLRVGVTDIWRLDLMSSCPSLSFRDGIGLKTTPGGAAFVCSALDATVVYRLDGIQASCPVRALHQLTREEVATLPKRDLP